MSTTSTAGSSTKPLQVLLLGVHMEPNEPLTEPALIRMIESDVERGRSQGLEISYELVHVGAPEYEAVATRLRERSWDVVAVGPGVRFVRERSGLFEGLVNAVLRIVKPLPLLVFNTTPDGVVEACVRARAEVERMGEV